MKSSKKRKHSSLPSVTVIPGLSDKTSALLLRTIKLYKKYLSASDKAAQNTSTTCTLEKDDGTQTNDTKENVQSVILSRIDSLQKGRRDEQNTLQALSRECEEEAQTLLDHLGSTDSNRKRSHHNVVNNHHQGVEEEDRFIPSDVVASLDFLMDMIQNVECKTILRRAAICTTGLLTKGREDYHSLMARTHLRKFTRTIGCAKMTSEDKNMINIVKMQEDGLRMLDTMSQCHSTYKPKLRIACRFLEEQKGIKKRLTIKESSESSARFAFNVVDLRKMRDIAIKHGRKEVRKVKEIVKRLDECFYVLVPRFGHGTVDKQVGTFSTNDNEDNDSIDWEDGDDIEHDNVDWEDGDNIEDDNIEWDDGDHTIEKQGSHSMEVEKTLAVMEKSGIFKNGSLAVPIGSDFSHLLTTDPNIKQNQAIDKKKDVVRYVNLLNKRHAPRISEWVHALTTADMMVESSDESHGWKSNASLIIMPASKRIQKGKILHALLKTKMEIARALLLASKIVSPTSADGSTLQPLTTERDNKGKNNLKIRGISICQTNDDNSKQPQQQKNRKKKTLQIRLRKDI